MGLFNPNAPLTADLNLLFQIFIFILLVGGIAIAKLRRKFSQHGAMMGVAATFNTVSILIVMIPSLLGFRGLLSNPLSNPALVVISHAIVGILVEILGIWLVVTWAVNRRNLKACVRRKSAMRTTVVLWGIELLLGLYTYIMLYLAI
ncbi:MAG: hypothetical protein JSV57_04530 [Candidatus Bathyarchaeota archaeon]|nr:MAG: hypothetical protein JSV57_04530 [Candidatus Bathyarchaeota archaeon]